MALTRIVPMVTEHDDGTVINGLACSEHGDTVTVSWPWLDGRRLNACTECGVELES